MPRAWTPSKGISSFSRRIQMARRLSKMEVGVIVFFILTMVVGWMAYEGVGPFERGEAVGEVAK